MILLDKPHGMSSRKAASVAASAVGQPKFGHAGTLDPLATGLLIVTLGRATLLSRFLAGGEKSYLVTALFGTETDSYDIDGKVVSHRDASQLSAAEINRFLEGMTGLIEQYPPPFSAVKYRGKPLYHYQRAGKEFELRRREVFVDSIELLSFGADEEGVKAGFRINCGPGTYVRSLVHDLGKKLGCGATVRSLRRVRSGSFDIDSTVPYDRFLEGNPGMERSVKTVEEATAFMPSITVEGETAFSVTQGKALDSGGVEDLEVPTGIFRVMNEEGRLLAIFGPPKKDDPASIIARAVRVIRASTLEVGDYEST